jgi:hypothetical protein
VTPDPSLESRTSTAMAPRGSRCLSFASRRHIGGSAQLKRWASRSMTRFRLVALFLGSAAMLAWARSEAAVIYQWIDETGRTQISDTVPEKYRRSAKQTDSRQFDLTPEARKAAEERRAALQPQAASAASRASSGPGQPPSRLAGQSAPRKSMPDLSNCDAWRRAFVESKNCFGGFQTQAGPLRQGAFETCGPEIPNPEPKCGPEKWQ